MSHDLKSSDVRLSGFAAASLWHRRMVRSTALNFARVRPRVSAALVLRPVNRDALSSNVSDSGRADSSCHAA